MTSERWEIDLADDARQQGHVQTIFLPNGVVWQGAYEDEPPVARAVMDGEFAYLYNRVGVLIHKLWIGRRG